MTSTGATAQQLLADPTPPPGRSFAEVLGDLRERIEHSKPIIQTLRSGWALLDETIGGVIRGEYIGLIAAPGVGKTTLADQIVVHTLIANPDANAIIFALETSTAVRAARLVASRCVNVGTNNQVIGCAPIRAMLRGELRDAGKSYAFRAIEQLGGEVGSRLRFIDNVTDDTGIASIIRAERPSIVLLDHLGLVISTSQSASEVARMDDSLGIMLGAIRESDAAALVINEVSKSALVSGSMDLVASRGTARFASLAALYIGIERLPLKAGQRDPVLVAIIHKSRFGDSFTAQQAVFFGGLCHFAWGPVRNVHAETQTAERGGKVHRQPSEATGAGDADGESKRKPKTKRKPKRTATT